MSDMSKYELNQEQQELDQRAQEAAEQTEEQESMGYSSDHYEWEMKTALENGNRIAYDNAKRNWANAKVKEQTGG